MNKITIERKTTGRLITLCLLALLQLTASAQQLTVEKTTIDVGKTGFSVPVTATFELKNSTSRTLTIDHVKTDCGCLQAGRLRKAIPAGESTVLSLTYDARLLGHFTKQAAVYVRGTNEPVWLTMKGVVLADHVDYSGTYPHNFEGLRVDGNVIEFDNVKKGEHPETVFNLLNDSETPMVPNLLHLPPYLSATATPPSLEPGRTGKLTITLNSEELKDYGLTQSTIYLAKNLGEKVSPDTEVPVSVVLLPEQKGSSQLAPRLKLSADSVNLDERHKKVTITLTNTGRSTLNVSSLQMFTGGMTVMLGKRQLPPGKSTKLKIAITDRDRLLRARSKPRVLMITDDPEQSKVVIQVNVK